MREGGWERRHTLRPLDNERPGDAVLRLARSVGNGAELEGTLLLRRVELDLAL